jgi:phage gp29-like protein
MPELVDRNGRPLRRDVLTREIAGPTLAGLRSPIAGYPSDGLNPVRLAGILRSADMGQPLSYFELAELIEERDPHYAGVLGTRKRSVAQLDITVEAASDDARDVAIADMVRDWLTRDELADELFDILDAIGKGDSFTEIIWDTSEGQWRPDRLEWRDPRWFEYDRADGRTPLLRGGEDGRTMSVPLEPFKFIRHTIKAKSGLPVRSGLARIAAWGWMFKAFTQRDWAIFAQTYGQPVRIGKFDSSASPQDRDTLFRAVANIAGDMAAIIPAGMEIEFIESKNVGQGSDLFEKRADWLDRQISKAVLGQTNTTDAQAGGLGSGQAQVHKSVADDIEAADAKGTAATLNRDLVRPWVDLEHGPQPRYPKVRIARTEPEDLESLGRVLTYLVPLGVRVEESAVRDRLGFPEPAPEARILGASASDVRTPRMALSPVSLQSAKVGAPPPPADQITDRLAADTEADVRGWLGTIATMMQSAENMGELREMIVSAYPSLDAAALTAKLMDGFTSAMAAGLSDAEDDGA